MKQLSLSLLAILISLSSFAHKPAVKKTDKGSLKYYTIEEAMKLQAKKPKKIVVDVYTDWCGWCKRMDANTFNSPEVSKHLNDNFYFVKFNAEGSDNVIFKDELYKMNAKRGTHELAIKWLSGKLGYPTIVYLDEKGNTISAVPGYYDAKAYMQVLNFFKEDAFKKGELEAYLKTKLQ